MNWTTIQLPGFYRIGKLVVYVLERVMNSLNQTINVGQTNQKLMQSFTYEDYHSYKSNKFPQPVFTWSKSRAICEICSKLSLETLGWRQ